MDFGNPFKKKLRFFTNCVTPILDLDFKRFYEVEGGGGGVVPSLKNQTGIQTDIHTHTHTS